MIGTQDGSRLANAGSSHVLSNRHAGIGDINLLQFFGCIEDDFFTKFIFQHLHKGFVSFYVNGTIAMGTG